MQSRFADSLGPDARRARVHTGPEAGVLALGAHAQAFSVGRDIFFKPLAFQPNTSSGQRLIAHELTHVVQQGAGNRPARERISRKLDPDGPLGSALGFGASLVGGGLQSLADNAVKRAGADPLVRKLDELRQALRGRREPVELPAADVERLLQLVERVRSKLPSFVPVPDLGPTRAALAVAFAAPIAIPAALLAAILAFFIAVLVILVFLAVRQALQDLADAIERALRPSPRPVPAPSPAPAPPVARPLPPPPTTVPRAEPKPDAKPIPVPVPIPLDRTRRQSQCRIEPLGFHRGGSVRHDRCADDKPPNVFRGSDVHVTTPLKETKDFDAMSPSGELWEVKTGSDAGGDFSSNPKFVQDRQIESDRQDIDFESKIATECGKPYVFAASDPARISILRGLVSKPITFKVVDC
jgi:hypothetical protein